MGQPNYHTKLERQQIKKIIINCKDDWLSRHALREKTNLGGREKRDW